MRADEPQPAGAPTGPVVAVLAPSPLLTVTIEAGAGGDEVHLHAGGQGLWIARMVAALGGQARLVGVFGGETGSVVRDLIEGEGIDVRAVSMGGSNGAYVHDRRSGERVEVATAAPVPLSRHEVDDWYGQALVECLAADVAVVAGSPSGVLPTDVYRRLTGDLHRNGTAVVADLSGAELHAALDSGGVDALKISHTELIEAGFACGEGEDELFVGLDAAREAGARDVVVSRGGAPTLAVVGGRTWRVRPPSFEAADTRGGGDAMAAALAVARAAELGPEETLQLAGAAGALTVARHGLASAHGEHVRRLAVLVAVDPVEVP
jgi:1-phosphofructokinase